MTILRAALVLILALDLAGCAKNNANDESGVPSANPIQEGPVETIEKGTTEKIMRDWRAVTPESPTTPDRSFRNVWVRMFPLSSTPLSDPYPETINKNDIELRSTSDLNLYTYPGAAFWMTGKKIEFKFAIGKIIVDGKNFDLQSVWIPSSGGDPAILNWDIGKKDSKGASTEVKVQARGGFLATTVGDSWSVINVVSVEEYLKSVVPSEVIHSWHFETLKAQSIAARTYGLYEITVARQKGNDFDVDPSTWYQSYQGVEFWLRDSKRWRKVETDTTSRAVDDTAGQLLLYSNEVIKAMFSANSGGVTCTLSECFQATNPPYFHQVADHPGVVDKPGGTWGTRANITSATIKAKLKEIGYSVGSAPSKLQHLERGPSDRTWRMRVLLRDGKVINLSRTHSRKFLSLFGPIRSYLFELGKVASNGKQSVVGHGFGHGVGMSQWGAELWASEGWDANRILTYYYKDSNIINLL